jgi:hypothetical protein
VSDLHANSRESDEGNNNIIYNSIN